MKTKFLTLLFTITSFISFSQTIENLKTEADKVYDATYTMDFEGLVNLSYPKIVESIGKETMLSKLDSDYENEQFRMRIQLEAHPVFQYSDIKKIEGKSFCIITYKNPVRYFFEEKLDAESAAKQAVSLKETNKTKEVTFEPKRNSFNVRRNSKIIAISDNATQNQWKFFNMDDADQSNVFQMLFSAELKKELGL